MHLLHCFENGKILFRKKKKEIINLYGMFD
jgi:hypothetical protein